MGMTLGIVGRHVASVYVILPVVEQEVDIPRPRQLTPHNLLRRGFQWKTLLLCLETHTSRLTNRN